MREPRLERPSDRAAWPLSRNAFMASVLVHLAGAYVVSRMVLSVELPLLPPMPRAEIVWLGARTPPPAAPPSAAVVPQPPRTVAPPPNVAPRAAPAEPPQAPRAAPERAREAVAPQPLAPAEEAESIAVAPRVAPGVDFAEERRRAAAEVVEARAREREYLTFSIDDVAPPRATPEPQPKRSIFDGGGADFGGRSVGTVGQQRTRFGRKLAELCNALTGGLGVAFQGLGLFSACAKPDDEPSGLFPEVRPAYFDLLPECAESQPENPELAAAAPFSTVKCRLVEQQLPARGAPR